MSTTNYQLTFLSEGYRMKRTEQYMSYRVRHKTILDPHLYDHCYIDHLERIARTIRLDIKEIFYDDIR